MKRRKPGAKISSQPRIGLAWFTREQWQRLTEVVADRSTLDDTFEQWERSAQQAIYELESRGHSVRKVMIDVETLLAWCRARGRKVDGAARADYVIALLGMADARAG